MCRREEVLPPYSSLLVAERMVHMPKYWENEKPVVVKSTKNTIAWYPQAGRLQVSLADWVNDKGEVCRGKTVTLDIDALRESDDADNAVKVFEDVLSQLKIR